MVSREERLDGLAISKRAAAGTESMVVGSIAREDLNIRALAGSFVPVPPLPVSPAGAAIGRMLTAMARELVENKGIGESADSVWRALGQLRPSTSARAEEGLGNMAIEHAETDIPTSCRCRSSRFRAQPSWRLPVRRAVPRAEIHLPVNCRYSEKPIEECVQGNQA